MMSSPPIFIALSPIPTSTSRTSGANISANFFPFSAYLGSKSSGHSSNFFFLSSSSDAKARHVFSPHSLQFVPGRYFHASIGLLIFISSCPSPRDPIRHLHFFTLVLCSCRPEQHLRYAFNRSRSRWMHHHKHISTCYP